MQNDDIAFYFNINANKLPIQEFGEFTRSPIEGAVLYFSYRLQNMLYPSMHTNIILLFYYFIHFLSALLLFYLINRILDLYYRKYELSMPSFPIAFLTALFFLVNPMVLECYSSLAFTVRTLGLLFGLIYLILKIQIYSKEHASILLASSISTLAALSLFFSISFYENNIAFLFGGLLLILLFQNKRKRLLNWTAETCLVAVFMLLNLVLFVTVAIKPLDLNIISIIKRSALYCINFIIPNNHGYLLIGTPIYTGVIGILFVKLITASKDSAYRRLASLLSLFILAFIVPVLIISYIAPRSLYTVTPAIAFLIVFSIYYLGRSTNIRQIVAVLLVASSILCFWNYFYLQNEGYRLLVDLKSGISTIYSKLERDQYFIALNNYSLKGAVRILRPDEATYNTLSKFLNFMIDPRMIQSPILINVKAQEIISTDPKLKRLAKRLTSKVIPLKPMIQIAPFVH
jgi:hypothetical protein